MKWKNICAVRQFNLFQALTVGKNRSFKLRDRIRNGDPLQLLAMNKKATRQGVQRGQNVRLNKA